MASLVNWLSPKLNINGQSDKLSADGCQGSSWPSLVWDIEPYTKIDEWKTLTRYQNVRHFKRLSYPYSTKYFWFNFIQSHTVYHQIILSMSHQGPQILGYTNKENQLVHANLGSSDDKTDFHYSFSILKHMNNLCSAYF